MEINELITAITTVGFPIVAYGALFWYILTKDKAYTEERKTMTEAINNNTVALTKLLDEFEKEN